MLYVIYTEDKADSLADRLATRTEHRARLQALHEEGRLILAGPNPVADSNEPGDAGFSGSTIVAEFASLADAQRWADADPYALSGVYVRVTVKPFIRVF